MGTRLPCGNHDAVFVRRRQIAAGTIRLVQQERQWQGPAGGLDVPNPFGLFDMHGSVYELCQDWYDAKWYEKSSPSDPTGPSSGSSRVTRGGGCTTTLPTVVPRIAAIARRRAVATAPAFESCEWPILRLTRNLPRTRRRSRPTRSRLPPRSRTSRGTHPPSKPGSKPLKPCLPRSRSKPSARS